MSPQQVDNIIKELKKVRIQQNPQVFAAMNQAIIDLETWLKGDMRDALPHQDELREWGLLKDGEQAADAPSDRAAPPAPSAPAAAADVADSDTAYEDRYREAEQKLADGFHYEARNIFRELQPKVRGRLRAPVQNGLTKASANLAQRTTYLIDQALKVERREKKNLVRQKEAWLAVLKENPDSQEANDAVTKLTQEMTDQEVRGEIRGLSEQAKKAAQDENLPTLNRMLGEIEGLRRRGEAMPPRNFQETV